jgi:DNA (cytosine-5)-methyltransferase 1
MIIHPIFDRTPTIREVARLQSFSHDFEILGTIYNQHQQLANAVPPLLGKAIANSVINILSEYES